MFSFPERESHGFRTIEYVGTKFYHHGSQTIKSDQKLQSKNAQTFPKCQLYFLEKWGHLMDDDVDQMREVYFKHLYEEEDKPLSYWRQPSNIVLLGKIKDSLPLSARCTFVRGLNWSKRTKILIKGKK